MKIYTRLVSFLLRVLCTYALRRGRYVDYTHQGQLYMRRYAIWGHLTGDGQAGLRARLPNLYVHQMINPDLDPCLHDHPWPWAVSWVALGGYIERRQITTPVHAEHLLVSYRAPALNFISGSTFHRIAGLTPYCPGPRPVEGCRCGCNMRGTWTIFLAGPRARAKTWGYLVPGTGYVSHSERHAEFGGEEKRGAPVNV